jgi:hypothetical protein
MKENVLDIFILRIYLAALACYGTKMQTRRRLTAHRTVDFLDRHRWLTLDIALLHADLDTLLEATVGAAGPRLPRDNTIVLVATLQLLVLVVFDVAQVELLARLACYCAAVPAGRVGLTAYAAKLGLVLRRDQIPIVLVHFFCC